MKKIVIGLFVFSIMLGIKLFADNMGCIPSVLNVFADVTSDLRCGSSNPGIVSIGNMTTTRFTYQPQVVNFSDVLDKVTTKIVTEADVQMNVSGGSLAVDSGYVVQGRYTTTEEFNHSNQLINSESKFIPYDSSGSFDGTGQGPGKGNSGLANNGSGLGQSSDAGGFSLLPEAIGNQEFYLDNTSGNFSNCESQYSSACLDQTYSEGVEFNPDLKTFSVSTGPDSYSQAEYSPPTPVKQKKVPDVAESGEPVKDSSSKTSPGSKGSSDKAELLHPELASWKLEKIIQSYNNFNEASERASQKNKEFEQRRKQQFEDYRAEIDAMARQNEALKQRSKEVLIALENAVANYKPPVYKPIDKSNGQFQVKKKFEYHKLDGQARKVIESQLSDAFDRRDIRDYIKLAEVLMNSNDYDLSKDFVRVNSSGVVQSNVFNKNLQATSIDKVDFSNVKSAHNREILRSAGNDFQSVWIESVGLANATDDQLLSYVAGVSLYQRGLSSAEDGGGQDFLNYMSSALDLLNYSTDQSAEFSRGFMVGSGGSIRDQIMALPELTGIILENYDQIPTTIEGWSQLSGLIVKASPEFKKALIDGAAKYRDDLLYGDAYRKGEITGFIVTEAISEFVSPTKALSAANKIFKIGDITGDLTKLAKITSPELATSLSRISGTQRSYIDDVILVSQNSKVSYITQNTEKIALQLIDESEDVTYAMKKMIGSTRDFNANSEMFTKGYGLIPGNEIMDSAESFSESLLQMRKLSSNLDKIAPIEIEGVASRYTKTEYLKRGSSPLDDHIGNVIVNSRVGVGGADGLHVVSYGFGDDVGSSIATSIEEMKTAMDNTFEEYSRGVTYIKMDGVLDLTDSKVRDSLGEPLEKLVSPININNPKSIAKTYQLPQSIGLLAKKKGFSGILLPSAQDSKGKVLHVFGDL